MPNQLTILRLLLIPVIGVSMQASYPDHDQAAAGIYTLAAVTDSLDGYLARRHGWQTELGKFLDPLADKLLVITVLALLVANGTLAAWVVIVIFAREFLITGLRSLAASQGVVVGSTPWGKSKTLSQNVMIVMLLLSRSWTWVRTPADVVVGIAVTATVLSGLDYLWRYRRFVLP